MQCDRMGVIVMIRTYEELIKLTTFEERFNYLKLSSRVSEITFGFDRYLNQQFYKSNEWRKVRRDIIARDMGCDLGLQGYEILGKKIIIHHMNPIKIDDIRDVTDYLLNYKYLITTCLYTHNAIHYSENCPNTIIERAPGDTKLW